MTSTQASACLRAIATVINNELLPALAGDYLRHRADLAVTMLSRLIADMESDHRGLYRETLAAGESPVPAPIAEALAMLDVQPGTQPNPLDRVGAVLAEGLAGAYQPFSPQGRALGPLIHTVAQAEHAVRRRAEAATAEVRRSIDAAHTSSAELAIEETPLRDYLRASPLGSPDLVLTRVTPIPGGRSKATILVDLEAGGETRQWVIRKDFSNNFIGSSVAAEYPIVRAAWEAGVSVPRPLLLEENPDILGGKFILFERVAGKPAGTMFDIHAEPGLVRQYAREMARLHRLDIAAAGLLDHLEFGRASQAVKAMVEGSYEKHRRNSPGNALLESAHIWMMNHIDCVAQRAALVHGDAGFHNVLGEGDRMTALLDWELAHAGDPAEDLMKCKAAASRVIPWEEFMAIYVEHGGAPLSAERERFFTLWRMVNFSLFADDARRMFLSGQDPDLRLAAIGYNTFSRLQEQLAQELAAAPV